jgi:hypothetical protein
MPYDIGASCARDKTALVIEQIRKLPSGFSLSQVQEKCPEVSYDMIRKVLKDLKIAGKIKAKGRGVSAQWHKGNNKGNIDV